MQITAVTPFHVADGRDFLFVAIHTDTGLMGLGEAGVTWREAAVAGFIDSLTPLLIGADPFRTEHLWQLMFRSGFFPGGRIGCAAISAIDIALWDLKAQALNVPLYQLLGGRVRDRVVCYPHVRGESPQELASDARAHLEAGWRFARFDLSPAPHAESFDAAASVRRCLADLEAVRDEVGDELELIVDVHTRLDPADAIRLCREAERFRPYFIEDPIRSENFESFRKLARHVSVPLAAGEQYASKWEFRQQIEEDLIDYCRLDVCIAGGITEALKVIGWCETHSIKMALHNPLGPVATAASLHLDVAMENFAVQELARPPGTLFAELFPRQVEFADGHLSLPDRPGLGLEFHPDAASRYPRLPEGACPQFHRADGSFTNW